MEGGTGTRLTWAVHGTGAGITVLNGAGGWGVQQWVFVAHMQSSDLGEMRAAARPRG